MQCLPRILWCDTVYKNDVRWTADNAGLGKRQFIYQWLDTTTDQITWLWLPVIKTTTDTLAEGCEHLVNARPAGGSPLMASELNSGLPLSVTLKPTRITLGITAEEVKAMGT